MFNTFAALATCVIVYSPGTNGDVTEKYWHEMAHCNGWSHGPRSAFGKAFQPPKKYLFVYPGPIDARRMSTREAREVCDGHFACQWFE